MNQTNSSSIHSDFAMCYFNTTDICSLDSCVQFQMVGGSPAGTIRVCKCLNIKSPRIYGTDGYDCTGAISELSFTKTIYF